ncbi:MAG: sulfurtransferase [Gammaproteobacteria bacterium]
MINEAARYFQRLQVEGQAVHEDSASPTVDDRRRSLLMTAGELAGRLRAGGKQVPVIVDCRFNLADPEAGRRAYLLEHLPGAWFADLNRDLSAAPGPGTGRHPLPEPRQLRALFEGFGINDSSLVVAYDAGGGMLAARVWWLLRWMGHRAVVVLDGGFQAWQQAGFPVDSALPQAGRVPSGQQIREQRFQGEPGNMPVMTTAQIGEALTTGSIRLLDVRSAERFQGQVEPIDPVAGHVPGAINAPCTDNLDAEQRFLAGTALRARYAPLIAGYSGPEIVCMCGSGVTACHGIMALELAGIPDAALYPGSWSEWIQSPDRPVAGLESR